MKVLTAAQMREMDRRTIEEFRISALQLMENAGTRVVEALLQDFPDIAQRNVVVLCGKGNNGGDGLVIARLLRKQDVAPAVILCADPEALVGEAAKNLERWREGGGQLRIVRTPEEWQRERGTLLRATVVIDALLGTGLKGPVEGLLRTVIEDVNALPTRCVVVSVDIPSGLSSDTADSPGPAIRAHDTVALAAPKLGEVLPPNRDSVGFLRVVDIGIPAKLWAERTDLKIHLLEPGEFRQIALSRRPSSHKGTYGHALLVAGSRGKTGAAVLAASGALRVGAGLVTVATPQSVWATVAAGLPEMMTHPLPETDAQTISMSSFDYGGFAALCEGKNVVAIGPGLSTHTETQSFIIKAVRECPLPLILDADGLNAFAGHAKDLRERCTPFLAITPHPGEMARLLGRATAEVQAHRLEIAQEVAAQCNAMVILKGQGTIVAAPDGSTFINDSGNPGMATGGTGDVLTGMLAGLTAQFGTGDWARVLGLGVFLHGRAGDFAAAKLGQHSLLASDLVEHIAEAFLRSFPPERL